MKARTRQRLIEAHQKLESEVQKWIKEKEIIRVVSREWRGHHLELGCTHIVLGVDKTGSSKVFKRLFWKDFKDRFFRERSAFKASWMKKNNMEAKYCTFSYSLSVSGDSWYLCSGFNVYNEVSVEERSFV